MNWKQFLKPDWRKIILFIVLSMIFYLILLSCSSFEGPTCPSYYYNFLLLPLFLISYLIPSIPHDLAGIIFVLYFINLVYWYLLSCLIVWIYDSHRQLLKSNRGKVFIGIIIVIIALVLYFSIFNGEICNELYNKLSEEKAKINISCNVDSDCIYNTDLYNPNSPCEGLCINKNADLRDYDSTWNEITNICYIETYVSSCPQMSFPQCKCVSNKCNLR